MAVFCISLVVNEHLEKNLNAKKSSTSRDVDNLTVNGNYYRSEGSMTINNYAAEKVVKKQKTGSEKEEETDDTDFKQKWVQFLADAENSKNFHRYSPEKNGVTRLGAKLSPHPNANKELYKALTKNLKSKEANENRSNIKSFIKKLTAAY
ncbi:unnamed protein product [Mucor hiemalis]